MILRPDEVPVNKSRGDAWFLFLTIQLNDFFHLFKFVSPVIGHVTQFDERFR